MPCLSATAITSDVSARLTSAAHPPARKYSPLRHAWHMLTGKRWEGVMVVSHYVVSWLQVIGLIVGL